MLVLTRKKNESILIGKNSEITVTLLELGRNQVSIGILADKDVPIMREELLLRLAEQTNKSTDPEPGPASEASATIAQTTITPAVEKTAAKTAEKTTPVITYKKSNLQAKRKLPATQTSLQHVTQENNHNHKTTKTKASDKTFLH